MDDFQVADLVEQGVVCQKWQVKLETECGDPEIVSECFAFFEGLRNGSDSGQNVSYADVKRNRLEIGKEHLATASQRLHLHSVFRLP